MDTHPLIVVDPYTVKFEGTEVWVGNYPYEYGCWYSIPNALVTLPPVLPSVKTRKRLRKLLLETVK
jgi:hypothetical protein